MHPVVRTNVTRSYRIDAVDVTALVDINPGQKVLTAHNAMPRETDFQRALCADINGFSLLAAVRCAAASAWRWSTIGFSATPLGKWC